MAGPHQTLLHVPHGKCPSYLPVIQGKQTDGQFHSHDTKSNFIFFPLINVSPNKTSM